MTGATDYLLRQLPDPSADADLLERFRRDRDADSFARLIDRFGPLVFGVARRVLRDRHDAEEVLQAAFLTLARKAHSLRRPGAVAAWLHAVTLRLARKSARSAGRRRACETVSAESPRPTSDPLDEVSGRELLAILDAEIQRLPECYRLPLVLCGVEGCAQDEAARRLGWTPGSVRGRLERGRKMLHARLERRGLTLPAGAALLLPAVGPNDVPAALVRTVLRAMESPFAPALAPVSAKWLLAAALFAGVGMGVGLFGGNGEPAAEPIPPPATATITPRTDDYGDPLPEGAVRRLGTIRLRSTNIDLTFRNGSPLAFRPDGKSFVSLHGNRHVHVWDAATGQRIASHALPVRSTSTVGYLSPDGKSVAVQAGDSGGPLEVWDIDGGKRTARLGLPDGQAVWRLAFSPRCDHLAVIRQAVSDPSCSLSWYDLTTGRERWSVMLPFHAQYVSWVGASPDGRSLVTLAGDHAGCWAADSGKPVWNTDGRGFYFAAFTPDSRSLIENSVHDADRLTARDAGTGRPSDGLRLPCTEASSYNRFAVLDDRTILASDPNDVRVWDMIAGKEVRRLPGTGPIFAVAPDGKSILTSNGVIQRWDLATGMPMYPDTAELGHKEEVVRVAYSPDRRRLATGGVDGTIRIWDPVTGRQLRRWPAHTTGGPGFNNPGVEDLTWVPGGRLVSIGDDQIMRVWDAERAAELLAIPLADQAAGDGNVGDYRLGVNSDGTRAVTVGVSFKDRNPMFIWGWDLAAGKRLSRFDVGYHNWPRCFSFTRDLRGVLTTKGRLLDPVTGTERRSLEGSSALLNMTDVAYALSPDGTLAAGTFTGTADDGTAPSPSMPFNGVRVWEVASGKPIAHLRTPVGDPHGLLAFAPDGRTLAVADLHGFGIWDIATGKELARFQPHHGARSYRAALAWSYAGSLAFAPEGRQLATGHPDGTILLWDVPQRPRRRPTADELARAWDDLASGDAARGNSAVWMLIDGGSAAVQRLADRLKPAVAVPAADVRAAIADLNDAQFSTRQEALQRLRAWGPQAEPALREALRGDVSLDQKRQIEPLLAALNPALPPGGDDLRDARAVRALASIGTPAARQVLKQLAGGDLLARRTRFAAEALRE
jgi:RNA polymerase sigma factor (sigma-70 family)